MAQTLALVFSDRVQRRRCDTILSGHVTRWYYARGAQSTTRLIRGTKAWATRHAILSVGERRRWRWWGDHRVRIALELDGHRFSRRSIRRPGYELRTWRYQHPSVCELWSSAMTSTVFRAPRKSRIVLAGSAIVGVVAPLSNAFLLGRLKPSPSPPNPWAPYFARAAAYTSHPVFLFIYLGICGAIVFWAFRPTAHKGQENLKLALMAMVIISFESFLIHWISGGSKQGWW